MNNVKTVLIGLIWLLIWPLAVSAVTQDEAATGPQNAPAIVTFGLSNRPGQAAVPTTLAEGPYQLDGLALRVENGFLHLTQAPAAPMSGWLSDGQTTVQVAVRADHHCISTSAELEAVLAWPAVQKAGQTICLNPGRYGGFKWWPHRGAFMNMQARDPITFRSTDASRPAILDGFFIGSTDDTPGGNVILRDLTFELTSPEVAHYGVRGLNKAKHAIYLGWQGGDARNVRIEDVVIRGNMGEAFKGALPVEDHLYGIYIRAERVHVRNVLVERVMTAFHIQGRDIVIERSRARRLWADMFQISAEVRPVPEGHSGPPPCRRTQRVVLRDNIMSDIWANNDYHPDFIHMYPSHRVQCGLDGVLIEGNIAYQGPEGARQPGFPTGFSASDIMKAPAQLALRPRLVQRLRAPATVTLPPAVCPDEKVMIGVQRVPGSGKLRVQPPAGSRLAVNAKPAPFYDFTGNWETASLMCRPEFNGMWDLRVEPPGPQGIFTNVIPGPDGYRNIIIRHNVLWIISSHGVTLIDPDNVGIEISNNSFLQPFPGDSNGDGRENTHADGFNELHAGTKLRVEGRGLVIRDNISSGEPPSPAPPGWGSNDASLRHNDGGRSMMQRFTPDPRHGFMPQNPRDAIEIARPKPGGIVAGRGVGAVAMTPQDDPYDWSWVPDR